MFNNIFKRRNEEAEELKSELAEGGKSPGLFSTDLIADKNKLNKQVNTALEKFKAPQFKPIEGLPSGFATDQAVGMDEANNSKAFAFNIRGIPDSIYSWYITQNFIGYQACAMLAQQWVIDKACTAPAEDAVANGYEISLPDASEDGDDDTDFLTKIRATDEKYKITKNLIEFERFNRVFGIRIALFKVDSSDKDYYTKPFNIDGVKKGSYKGIAQIDPYWITPELDATAVSDPSSIDFYEPTYWRVSGKLYHKSHLCIIRYSEVPDVLKPTYIYGGLPLTQLLYERVYAAERTANEAPQLAMTKRTTALNVDMEAVMANQAQVEEKISVWSMLRDNYGVKMLGLDEQLTETDTSLADLDNVIMSQYQLVASIAGIPAVRLLETTPKGFNATGEFESRSYHEKLGTIQDNNLTGLLKRHYELVIKSETGNTKDFDIVWNPTDEPTRKERSELRFAESQSDLNYVNMGAVGGDEIRDKLATDKNSGFNNLELAEELEDEDEDNLFNLDEMPKLGFVSVRPRKSDAWRLVDLLKYGAGIDGGIEEKDLHITLMYAPDGIGEVELSTQPLLAYPTGEVRILGEGEYRSIALMLKGEDLSRRHEEIKALGAEHSHDEFLPHISLKYQPTDEDIGKIMKFINSEDYKDGCNRMDVMIVDDERWEPIK